MESSQTREAHARAAALGASRDAPREADHDPRSAELHRHRGEHDPAAVAAAREYAASDLADHVRRVVDQMPALSPAQVSRLRSLLGASEDAPREADHQSRSAELGGTAVPADEGRAA
ncbi:MAG: hypothetical protein GEV09_08660 [Pseudonocardiaceae bacterium]|nr:hypothetical protein [Pseudonocardiaceae bacterium]